MSHLVADGVEVLVVDSDRYRSKLRHWRDLDRLEAPGEGLSEFSDVEIETQVKGRDGYLDLEFRLFAAQQGGSRLGCEISGTAALTGLVSAGRRATVQESLDLLKDVAEQRARSIALDGPDPWRPLIEHLAKHGIDVDVDELTALPITVELPESDLREFASASR
jgi:hypothetical protein